MAEAIRSSAEAGGMRSVQDALKLMQQAVRKGELQQAAAIGATAAVPLSIRVDELSLLGEIASGAEATVLYGSLNDTDVAVKRFKMHHPDDLKRFRQELATLASLAPHPNIVPLLGARALPPDYLLVMPLAAATLHSKLYQLGWRPNTLELLHLAVQAAEGLAAVHAKGLVHRDIKPSNMLVGYEGQLWLSDFGLAASVEEVVQESTLSIGMVRSRGKPTGGFLKRAMRGTLEYMAPEQLLKHPASQASDVYALAVTINELATGVYPFSDCTKDNPEIHTVLEHGYGRQELATAVASEGLRPTLSKTAPQGLRQLLQAAWQLDPAARPTAVQLRDALVVELLQQQQQQQQQMSAIDGGRILCCDGAPVMMDVDESAEIHALSHCSSRAGFDAAGTSAGLGLVADDDSETLASSDEFVVDVDGSSSNSSGAGGVRRLNGTTQQLGFSGRGLGMPRVSHASVSTVSTELTGFNSVAGSVSVIPVSIEAANAAAAAAAASAVPTEVSKQGVLSLVAAMSSSSSSDIQQQQQHQESVPVVSAGAFGALGPRESMEDRYVVVHGLGGDEQVMLAAVFDGHRGHEAAAYAAAHLPKNLLISSVQGAAEQQQGQQQLPPTDVQPAADDSSAAAAVLKRAFLSTDAGFWQEWQAEMHAHAVVGQYSERYPGSTALAAVIAGKTLYVANAGDGRAVLSRGGTAVSLSRQHTADLEDERRRVLAAGGTVTYRGGSWRVGPAALQVTRAFGDFDLKQPTQQQSGIQQQQVVQPALPGQLSGPVCLMSSRGPYHSFQTVQPASSGVSSSSNAYATEHQPVALPPMPVTADPEVVSLHLSSSDQFLILGTDGLWDVMTDQEAVGLVHDTVKDPALCAKRLVQEALARSSTDNVSAVVVFLQPKHTLESVWVRGAGAAVPHVTPTFFGSRRMTTKQLEVAAGSSIAVAAAPAGAADEIRDTY